MALNWFFIAGNSGHSEGEHPDVERVCNSRVDEQPSNASEVPHPNAEVVTNSSVRQGVGEMFHCDVCEYITKYNGNLKNTHLKVEK